jgi:hypothetical protein
LAIAFEVELSADELKEPLATYSAMSWSKQYTTVRRCGDHNEHPLQHHNAHCTAEEEGTHKSFLCHFPHNKTTQKQKIDGTYSAELQAQMELPGLGQAAAPHTSGGWLDTASRCRIKAREKGVASRILANQC